MNNRKNNRPTDRQAKELFATVLFVCLVLGIIVGGGLGANWPW